MSPIEKLFADVAAKLTPEQLRLARRAVKVAAELLPLAQQAFEPASPGAAALAHLGLQWPCTEEDVRSAFSRRVHETHPDRRPGSTQDMGELTAAKDAAITYVRARCSPR